MKRGIYNEIFMSTIPARSKKIIINLVKAASAADKVDKHGAWEFGAEFDSKGRGAAINWDVYGYGKDVHSGRMLAVIQVRKYEKRHKNWYPTIHKSYFLLGRNEDNTVFAHPVESRTVHAAVKRDDNVVLAVQNWIFGGDYKRMLRQGDMALLPLSKKPALKGAEPIDAPVRLSSDDADQGSHLLAAKEIYRNGSLYAKSPHMIHEPGTHPEIKYGGWCKVIVGKRSDFWNFAAPTID